MALPSCALVSAGNRPVDSRLCASRVMSLGPTSSCLSAWAWGLTRDTPAVTSLAPCRPRCLSLEAEAANAPALSSPAAGQRQRPPAPAQALGSVLCRFLWRENKQGGCREGEGKGREEVQALRKPNRPAAWAGPAGATSWRGSRRKCRPSSCPLRPGRLQERGWALSAVGTCSAWGRGTCLGGDL